MNGPLTDAVLELLTAAVDGELSAGERKRVRRILDESEEARKVYRTLKIQAGKISKLPPRKAPANLADRVERAIQQRALTPSPVSRTKSRPPALNRRAAAGLAMSVLCGLSAIMFLLIQSSRGDTDRDAANGENGLAFAPPSTPDLPHRPNFPIRKDRLPSDPPVEPKEIVRNETLPQPREIEPTLVAELLSSPREVIRKDPLTGPVLPDFNILRPYIGRVPYIGALRELDQAAHRKSLADEMGRSEMIYIMLFTKDTAKAHDRIAAALKAKHHGLTVEATVTDKLKAKKPTECAYFTDGLTSDEAADVLNKLAAEDKKAGDAAIFDKFILTVTDNSDFDRVARWLGVTASQLKPVKSKISLEPGKPLEAGTASQLAEKLGMRPTSPGNSPSPGSPGASPNPKAPERMAFCIGYSATRTQAAKEVKPLWDKRGDRNPAAVPVVIVTVQMN